MTEELIHHSNKKGLNLVDAHFFSLPSQGNVYTLTPLTDAKGFTKILVASLQRKVYCLEYSNGRPCMREVPFTYIPGGAEIISINAVNRSIIQEDFIIGITIIKKDDGTGKQSHFFNVYSDWDLNSDSALDVVSQNCHPLELDFVPYQLYHTKTKIKSGWETVWLLSGSDNCIHMYHSDDESHSYQEMDCSESFPEFTNMTDIALWIDISYSSDNKRRVSAICGERGSVHMYFVNVESTPQVNACHTVFWDYPAASVKIFNLNVVLPIPKFLQGFHRFEKELIKDTEAPVHIVVGNTLESCFIYRDFVNNRECYRLPESDANDVVTCCLVCDIDQDGKNEVLVGTYGEIVIVYKHNEEEQPTWDIYHTIKVPCPVLSMAYCDVMGDGSFQLVVMTTTGIHIIQHNPWELASVIFSRLEALTESKPVLEP